MNKTDSILHLKVSNTFSNLNHTVNQNTKSLTLAPTFFFKETCLVMLYMIQSTGPAPRLGAQVQAEGSAWPLQWLPSSQTAQ